jgi:isochorismate synthase EntC
VACTPERLYVRSGRHVASEAVAGTRPRGAPGDVEADFYLGLDLLKSPKDHAEFTMTRDWISAQLAALPGGCRATAPYDGARGGALVGGMRPSPLAWRLG